MKRRPLDAVLWKGWLLKPNHKATQTIKIAIVWSALLASDDVKDVKVMAN